MVAGLFSKGLLLLGLFSGLGAAQNGSKPLYKNPNAPSDDRVEDLLKRMTIEDKMAQLIQGAFAHELALINLSHDVSLTYHCHRRSHQLDGRRNRGVQLHRLGG